MVNNITAIIGMIGGFLIGWGLRGYMEKRKIETKNKKKSRAFID